MDTLNTTHNPYNRFQWSAVAAGSLLAIAIAAVLSQFGAAIGLSALSPLRGEANIAAWGIVATGIWLLWVQLLASLAGGYLAGRLRTPISHLPAHDAEIRDGIAGISTWALSTVFMFVALGIAAAFATYAAIATDTYQAADTLTNHEKNKAIIFAFSAGGTSLMSAVAAWWAGTKGGEHRDQNTDFSTSISFRKKA